jgi:hypothetical protein
MRYLGLLMTVMNDPLARLFVVAEAAARVIKNHLRLHLRSASEKLKIPMEAPYRQVVVDLLNKIFSATDNSLDYWTRELVPEMKLKFSFSEFSLLSKSDSWFAPSFSFFLLIASFYRYFQVCGQGRRFPEVIVLR